MTARRLRDLLLVSAVPIALAAAGCGSVPSGTGNLSLVRVLNAYIAPANQSATLTVTATYSDNSTFTLSGPGGLAFGKIAPAVNSTTTTFAFVQSGALNLQGTGNGLSTPMTFPTKPTLVGNGTAYTIVAGGQSGQSGTLAPQFFILSNYMMSALPIPAGDVALRFVNVSLNANPIGLYNASGAVASGFASMAYGADDTLNTYALVPTSQLSGLFIVDTTATGTPLTLSAASNLSGFKFVAGDAYTIYVYGQPGNMLQPLGATVALDHPVE